MERDIISADITFVGAGPACLSGAVHMKNLIDDHNELAAHNEYLTSIPSPKIIVLEKGSDVGAHGISGTVLDPRTLNELSLGWKEDETFPVELFVEREQMLLLSAPRRYSDLEYDGEYIVDKLSDVCLSGSIHDEHQPCHVVVPPTLDHCVTKCTEEYGNPCERFCPAQVYNIVEDSNAATGKRLQVDFSNCVHCKTCDIRDPYQVIKWIPPEGEEGPECHSM